MIVGIDAHTIGHKHTGNETYILNLLRALRRLQTEYRYRVFLTPEGLQNELLEDDFFDGVRVPANPWLRFAFGLPLGLRTNPVDLLHVQYAAPLGFRGRLVTTIHDVSYVRLPEHFRTLDRLRLERLLPATARRAERIITCSEASKNDIAEFLGVSEDKIVVTPYGVSPEFRRIEDRAEVDRVLRGMGLESGYILYVGTLQPRKNVVRLLKAFDLLKRAEQIAEKLVIVGKKAWMYEDILDTHAGLASKDDVAIVDYVSQAQLPYVYNGARVFVYPSVYEGFGLPPLEAMACGVPVAVSNAPAIPEVVGDTGVYFDPLSVESIADAVYRLLRDERMSQDLGVRGQTRAAGFSWQETARATLRTYQEALG